MGGAMKSRKRLRKENYTGCLLGGAVGDALGWPVEFEELDGIIRRFGPKGVMQMIPGKGGRYEITDDTQLTLFTAEGLLRGWVSSRRCGTAPDFAAALKRSYLCWLRTQGRYGEESYPEGEEAGWLLTVKGLHETRAPGETCLSALCDLKLSGPGLAANAGKGCGGVMRAAPPGLLAVRIGSGDGSDCAREAFAMGCQAARLTHGHPSGYYPAGILAAVVASVVQGETVEKAIELSLEFADDRAGTGETVEAVRAALRLYRDPTAPPAPETVESLGEGWIAVEALAIGLYCALAAGDDFARGVRLAVNHSGDSDSTGSITGNVLGALLGEQAIPRQWLERLELEEVIRQIGSDLFTGTEETESWLRRYPPCEVQGGSPRRRGEYG
jgi:ADP-ribosyl-[dinitrogen reductase] hydrolase